MNRMIEEGMIDNSPYGEGLRTVADGRGRRARLKRNFVDQLSCQVLRQRSSPPAAYVTQPMKSEQRLSQVRFLQFKICSGRRSRSIATARPKEKAVGKGFLGEPTFSYPNFRRRFR
jgi:hypothetical protein